MFYEQIQEKKEYLNSLRKFTIEELELIKSELIRANVHENPSNEELEGIKRTYETIEYIMKEESSFPYPKGYRHPLTESMLQDLNRTILSAYKIYLPCEKGFYRLGKGNARIGDILLPDKEIFLPRLKELIAWYGETDDDLVTKLAVFHLKFLCDIHPFCDGNGRTARALMNLELSREGYPMIGLKYSDIDAYEEAFDAYINNNDEDPMIRLIYQNVDNQLDMHIAMKKN